MQKTCPRCGWPMTRWERVGVWRCAGCGEEIPFTPEEHQQMDILRRAGYGAGSEPAEKKLKFIKGLHDAEADEMTAQGFYNELAKEAESLGLAREAKRLREIASDEFRHWTILDKMLRAMR